jgi:hypothetical protein
VGFLIGAIWGALFGQLGVRWGWIYWSMAIGAILYAVSAAFVIPSSLNKAAGGSFDILGSFIGVTALILIFFSLKYILLTMKFNFASSGPTLGWNQPYTYTLLIVGVLCVGLFVLVERKVEHPVLPLQTFSTKTFGAVVACVALGWMSFGMFTYYLPQLYHLWQIEI